MTQFQKPGRIAKWWMIFPLLTLPATLHAQPNAGGSFEMSAVVPEYCEISVPALTIGGESGSVAGMVLESCNTQQGYSIVATHRELEVGENVALTYAGVENRLHRSGWNEVATRSGARYGWRPVAVNYSSLQQPLTINLTVTLF